MTTHLTFIVSGGRTGTQFLGDLMSEAIEDSYSEHEPDIFRGFDRDTLAKLRRFGLWHMVVGRALGLSGVRVLGTRHLVGRESFADTARRLRAQRKAYHASVAQGLLIESYYAWWMVAPRLPEIFPGAKVLGVVRDPRHWIESWRHRARSRADGHWTHLLPPGPLNPNTVGDERWASRWDGLGDVGRLAWQWALVNGRIAQAEDNGVASVYLFEDIFDPASGKLHEMCTEAATFPDRRFAVADPAGLIGSRRNASKAGPKAWEAWSQSEREIVAEICGPLMDRFGYPPIG